MTPSTGAAATGAASLPSQARDWTFDSARAYWDTWNSCCNDVVWDQFLSAEQFLMAAPPRDLEQARVILSVVISNTDDPNYAEPLRRVRSFLTNVSPQV